MATLTNKDLAFQHIEAEINLMQKTSQRSVIRANQYAVIYGAVKAYLNLGVFSDKEAQQLTKTALFLLKPTEYIECRARPIFQYICGGRQ